MKNLELMLESLLNKVDNLESKIESLQSMLVDKNKLSNVENSTEINNSEIVNKLISVDDRIDITENFYVEDEALSMFFSDLGIFDFDEFHANYEYVLSSYEKYVFRSDAKEEFDNIVKLYLSNMKKVVSVSLNAEQYIKLNMLCGVYSVTNVKDFIQFIIDKKEINEDEIINTYNTSLVNNVSFDVNFEIKQVNFDKLNEIISRNNLSFETFVSDVVETLYNKNRK